MPAVTGGAKGVRMSNAWRAGIRNTYSARAQVIRRLPAGQERLVRPSPPANAEPP